MCIRDRCTPQAPAPAASGTPPAGSFGCPRAPSCAGASSSARCAPLATAQGKRSSRARPCPTLVSPSALPSCSRSRSPACAGTATRRRTTACRPQTRRAPPRGPRPPAFSSSRRPSRAAPPSRARLGCASATRPTGRPPGSQLGRPGRPSRAAPRPGARTARPPRSPVRRQSTARRAGDRACRGNRVAALASRHALPGHPADRAGFVPFWPSAPLFAPMPARKSPPPFCGVLAHLRAQKGRVARNGLLLVGIAMQRRPAMARL